MLYLFDRFALGLLMFLLVAATPVPQLPPESIYNLQAYFYDDSGARRQLKELQGTPVIITFIYTQCKSACPLTLERLRKLKSLASLKNPEIRFALVSLDSRNDSSAALKEFRKSRHLDDNSWVLLTGDETDIRTLSVLLGYSFKRTENPDNPISHSNRMILLDKEGRVVTVVEGLNSDVSTLIDKIASYTSRQ